jgi:hypothetical protein
MEATVEPVDEDEKVFLHRVMCFLDLGYDVDDSHGLAAQGVDHHAIASLIRKGCSKELAAEILV